MSSDNFWLRKKILITGANGFVGSNLATNLLQKNAQIITLTRSGFSKTSKVRLDKLHKKVYKNIKGSIEDFKMLNKIIKDFEIDIIYHLAAQPLVEIGHGSPTKTFEINIRGTWNILEAARVNNIQKIIVASTSHVYGDNPKLPFKEKYFPQPSRPYETSKAAADLLAQSFADTYNLPVEIPRFVNLYGPGDLNFSRVVPKIVKNVLKNEHPRVWDLGSIRDFLFIEDAIEAFLILAQKKLPKGKRIRVTNFGSGVPIDILDLVRKIVKTSGNKRIRIKIEQTPTDRKKEIKRQFVSISKAKKEFGWYPKYSLDEGLKKTLEWYKENWKQISE